MKKIVFVSDYFLDEITGGAELCNDALIEDYLKHKYDVLKIKSININIEFLKNNKNSLFIIANYMQLNPYMKEIFVQQNYKYIIYEHDHKYLKSNNPALFNYFLANEEQIQNLDFCKKAIAVLCQSKLHTEIMYKNTLLKNIVNLGGNIWSRHHLSVLEKNIKTEDNKVIDNYVYDSNNQNKGRLQTIEYCKKNNIQFSLIKNSNYEDFMANLSNCKRLIFFPTWIETFSRFAVEAKILNCKIKTNNYLGCASEGLLDLNGIKLLQAVKIKMENIYNIFSNLIEDKINLIQFYSEKMPRITIMCTFVDAEKYVEQYLQEITKQTIFDEIDLFIVDCDSNGREKEIILNYKNIYKNINYIRIDEKITIPAAFNLVINKTNNKFISMIQVDDRPSPTYCEILRKHLFYSLDCELVYGDCLQTNVANEIFENNTSNLLYEHSLMPFTKENMIKCLPGPMPMFKKQMLEKNGNFNEYLIYANDWELWLRCVRGGSKFKKINTSIGLYYYNPNGKSTSLNNIKEKMKEEKDIFNDYIDIIGQKNYNMYRQYFNKEE